MQAASAPREPGSGAWRGSLPFDVLVHLFSFVPLYPRMLALRPVCRIWNAAALSATEDINPLPIGRPAIINLFSNLTSLKFTSGNKPDALPLVPPRLRQLTIPEFSPYHFGSNNLRKAMYPYFTSVASQLTALSIGLLSEDTGVTLLRCCASSLRLLELSCPTNFDADLKTQLLAVDFPSLRSLTLASYGDLPRALMHRLSSQLVELTIPGRFGCDDLADAKFPRLKQLSMAAPYEASPVPDSVLAILPQLESFHVDMMYYLPPAFAPYVTEVTMQPQTSPPDLLRGCTRLQKIHTEADHPESPYIMLLTSMRLSDVGALAHAFRLRKEWPRLTDLSLMHYQEAGSADLLLEALVDVKLPALQTLFWAYACTDPLLVVRSLDNLLDVAPRLSQVRASLPPLEKEEHREAVRALLRRAQSRGVARFVCTPAVLEDRRLADEVLTPAFRKSFAWMSLQESLLQEMFSP